MKPRLVSKSTMKRKGNRSVLIGKSFFIQTSLQCPFPLRLVHRGIGQKIPANISKTLAVSNIAMEINR